MRHPKKRPYVELFNCRQQLNKQLYGLIIALMRGIWQDTCMVPIHLLVGALPNPPVFADAKRKCHFDTSKNQNPSNQKCGCYVRLLKYRKRRSYIFYDLLVNTHSIKYYSLKNALTHSLLFYMNMNEVNKRRTSSKKFPFCCRSMGVQGVQYLTSMPSESEPKGSIYVR